MILSSAISLIISAFVFRPRIEELFRHSEIPITPDYDEIARFAMWSPQTTRLKKTTAEVPDSDGAIRAYFDASALELVATQVKFSYLKFRIFLDYFATDWIHFEPAILNLPRV